MPIQRETKLDQDRRQSDLSSIRNIGKERRMNRDPQGSNVDDADEFYDSELGASWADIGKVGDASRND